MRGAFRMLAAREARTFAEKKATILSSIVGGLLIGTTTAPREYSLL